MKFFFIFSVFLFTSLSVWALEQKGERKIASNEPYLEKCRGYVTFLDVCQRVISNLKPFFKKTNTFSSPRERNTPSSASLILYSQIKFLLARIQRIRLSTHLRSKLTG